MTSGFERNEIDLDCALTLTGISLKEDTDCKKSSLASRA
jgi:hypothetical protein